MMDRTAIESAVTAALGDQPITDMHTHCYTPGFGASPDPGGLLLWGIDELVTYHYLIAEVYRVVPSSELAYDAYWKMSKTQQADHIWQHLFVERTPISEACRGVLTTLKLLGLDPNEKSLDPYRRWFGDQTADGYIDTVMQIANIDSITMTNEVFTDHERQTWLASPGVGDDPRFEAVLRLDPLLRDWPVAAKRLVEWGYDVSGNFSAGTIDEVRRFLRDWIKRFKAVYAAVSLPPDFQYPDPHNPDGDRVISNCLMPVLAEFGLPWALMIGCARHANPELRDAGDMVGKADIRSVINLCSGFGENKFLVTMLSRENQHELCVAARKFDNLMVFGCWWFLNNPSLVEQITRMRIELLGTSFIPQHSDARILDQMLYKWDHSRRVIGKVLIEKYADLVQTGYELTQAKIRADVAMLMRDNFRRFVTR